MQVVCRQGLWVQAGSSLSLFQEAVNSARQRQLALLDKTLQLEGTAAVRSRISHSASG